MTLKLGRLPRTYRRLPHWSALRHAAIAAPVAPPAYNWLAGMMPAGFGMMLNDTLGCCVSAAAYHARQVWTFHANSPENTQPDAEVLATYEQFCNYNPHKPSTDQGCIEQDVLNNWHTTGLPLAGGARDKLMTPPIEIDVRNINDICEAIYQCGLVFIGFNVPAYLMASAPPFVWTYQPTADRTIVGGHAVVLCGYHRANKTFELISWGQAYRMKFGFFENFTDEAYALCDPTWIARTGKTPLGLTVAQLEALAGSL